MASKASQLLTVDAPSSTPGLAIISIHREPVNSMNKALWQALSDTLTQLEANPSIRAVIFRSGLKRPIFTAGNDINELHARRTTRERYVSFWLLKNQFLARLLRSRLSTAAAIKGACPAAGTCLAMCCDVRIATKDVTMGLNEVRLDL
ncbi:dodecenoyl-CoA isomerase [Rhizophlyctis rosea]|nr:dodecenoyl-CoA isomerase [Rhizophlyctis rosea]